MSRMLVIAPLFRFDSATCPLRRASDCSASSAAALITFAIALRMRLNAGAELTPAGIAEAVVDVPFDA